MGCFRITFVRKSPIGLHKSHSSLFWEGCGAQRPLHGYLRGPTAGITGLVITTLCFTSDTHDVNQF